MLKLLGNKNVHGHSVSIVTAFPWLRMSVFQRPVLMFPESQAGSEDKTNVLTVCKSLARKLTKHHPQEKQRVIFKHLICSETT
jgi:hypothetical protein